MSTDDCPCCFEPIAASVAVLSCSHRFHITCLVNWFATQSAQELPQNCPCCRAEAGENERLPEESEEAEGDESEYDEDEEGEIMLTRSQLDAILRAQDGSGVMDSLWFAFFEPEGDEEIRANAEHRLPFTSDEISRMALYQGGHVLSDEVWEALVDRFGEDEDAEAEEADGEAAPAAPAEAPEAPLRIKWRRRPDGSWFRDVLNPEEHEPAVWGEDSGAPPPDELVDQTTAVARKVQAIWRGYKERTTYAVVRNLMSLRRV
jgi:hypothetical protein